MTANFRPRPANQVAETDETTEADGVSARSPDAVEDELGQRIGELHRELLEAPVPDRFKQLLDKLLDERKRDQDG